MNKLIYLLCLALCAGNSIAQKKINNKQLNRLFMFNDSLDAHFEKFNAARYFAFQNESSKIEKAKEDLLKRYKIESLPYHFNGDGYMILPDESIMMTTYTNWPRAEFIYPHPPCFYMIQKIYYKNGNIRSKGRVFGKYTKIGTWYYFDSTGKLTQTVDEDKKIGRITYKDVISLLYQKKLIDIYTGTNADGIEAIFRDSVLVGDHKYWNIQFTSRKDYFAGEHVVLLDRNKPVAEARKEAIIKLRGYHLFYLDGLTGEVREGDIIEEPSELDDDL